MTDNAETNSPFTMAAIVAAYAAKCGLPLPPRFHADPARLNLDFDDHATAEAWIVALDPYRPNIRHPRPDLGVSCTHFYGRIDGVEVWVGCQTEMTAEEIAAAMAEAVLTS